MSDINDLLNDPNKGHNPLGKRELDNSSPKLLETILRVLLVILILVIWGAMAFDPDPISNGLPRIVGFFTVMWHSAKIVDKNFPDKYQK